MLHCGVTHADYVHAPGRLQQESPRDTHFSHTLELKGFAESRTLQ